MMSYSITQAGFQLPVSGSNIARIKNHETWLSPAVNRKVHSCFLPSGNHPLYVRSQWFVESVIPCGEVLAFTQMFTESCPERDWPSAMWNSKSALPSPSWLSRAIGLFFMWLCFGSVLLCKLQTNNFSFREVSRSADSIRNTSYIRLCQSAEPWQASQVHLTNWLLISFCQFEVLIGQMVEGRGSYLFIYFLFWRPVISQIPVSLAVQPKVKKRIKKKKKRLSVSLGLKQCI